MGIRSSVLAVMASTVAALDPTRFDGHLADGPLADEVPFTMSILTEYSHGTYTMAGYDYLFVNVDAEDMGAACQYPDMRIRGSEFFLSNGTLNLHTAPNVTQQVYVTFADQLEEDEKELWANGTAPLTYFTKPSS